MCMRVCIRIVFASRFALNSIQIKPMKPLYSILYFMLILSGCSSLPDAPTEVLIPVAVSCLSEIPPLPPLVTDAQLLAMPDAAFVLALAADRLERQKYMAITAALLQACLH